jgi:EamA domain-containing membrane protein RarD
VLLGGALLTAWWYRHSGRRTGIEGRPEPALVAAALAVMAYVTIAVVPASAPLVGTLELRSFGPLLVVAVGVLALAWQERSTDLRVTAVAFAAAAVLANTHDLVDLGHRLGWTVPDRLALLPDLALPAAVLLAGAAVARVRARPVR